MFPNGNMKIDSILVTQRKLKRKELVKHLVGEILIDAYIPPIQLVQLEDGTVYCKDGHHRLAAYYLAGYTEINPIDYDLLFSDRNIPTFGNIQRLLA
jgi:hypothetical protein